MGDGIFTLDVDPRAGGDVSLAKLLTKYDLLPQTVTAVTGGGGEHYVLGSPKGVLIKNSASVLGPGLDIKGDGGQIVVEPSLHPDTKQRYRWKQNLSPWDLTPAPCPDWLLALITSTEPTSRRAPQSRRPQTVADVGNLPAALNGGAWPIEGSGYHAAVLALAGVLLRSGGLLPNQVMDLMYKVVPPREKPRPLEIVEAVTDTERRIANNRPVTGWPSLRQALGGDGAARLGALVGLEPPTRSNGPPTSPTTRSNGPPTSPPPDDVLWESARRLRDGAVRWTTPHLLDQVQGGTPATLAVRVAQGALSWEDALDLVGGALPSETLARASFATSVEPYCAPGVSQLASRTDGDGDPTAPTQYVTDPPALPHEGSGWLLVGSTGGALVRAETALSAPRAEKVTIGELVDGRSCTNDQVIVWRPSEIALAIERAPRRGARSSGERHAALVQLLSSATIVIGVDQVPTDLAHTSLGLWTQGSVSDTTTRRNLTGWTYYAHAEDDDVLGHVVAAAQRGDRVMFWTPRDDVPHVVTVLAEQGVAAQHWGAIEATPDTCPVWVEPLGSSPPAQLGTVDVVAVLGRLARAGWPEVLSGILDAAPTTRTIHGRLAGGHDRETTLEGVDNELADALERQTWALERASAPPSTPARDSTGHTAAALAARVHINCGTWGVGRTWRWALLSHGAVYTRGEPAIGAPENLHAAVVTARNTYETAQLEAASGAATGSRQWLEDVQGSVIAESERPMWLATIACAGLGPDFVPHDPPRLDENPERGAPIAVWAARGSRRQVVAASVAVALTAGAWKGAADRDIAEARTGYPAHAGGHTARVAAGMVAGELVLPSMLPGWRTAHPNQITETTQGVQWCDVRDDEVLPDGMVRVSQLAEQLDAECQRRGLPSSSLPEGERKCQWYGTTLTRAGVPTQKLPQVTIRGVRDGIPTSRRAWVYKVDVDARNATIRYARWLSAGRLGWALPDPLDRRTRGDEWKQAIAPDGTWRRAPDNAVRPSSPLGAGVRPTIAGFLAGSAWVWAKETP